MELEKEEKENEGDLYSQKIIFKDTPRHHEDLKIKLQYDKITQTKFFRTCIAAYLSDNLHMREIIDALKPQTTAKKAYKKDIKEVVDTKKKFALDEEDVENIFDIIESEHPNL